MFVGNARRVSSYSTIGGAIQLPEGFIIIQIPPGTPLRAGSWGEATTALSDEQLAAKHNVATILIGLIQLILGLITLYRARGDQIRLYGYAAFGLSVAPYAVMSIANSAAALVTPEYPLMLLVWSPDMHEAEECGAKFDGVYATIDIDAGLRSIPLDPLHGQTRTYAVVASILCAISPLAIVGGLSGFQIGQQSTASQHGWILSWLVASMVFPFCYRFLSIFANWGSSASPLFNYYLPFGFLYVSSFVPAIRGMVTGFLMLRDYGVCTRF